MKFEVSFLFWRVGLCKNIRCFFCLFFYIFAIFSGKHESILKKTLGILRWLVCVSDYKRGLWGMCRSSFFSPHLRHIHSPDALQGNLHVDVTVVSPCQGLDTLESDDSRSISPRWIRWNLVFMNKPLTKRQTGRDLRSVALAESLWWSLNQQTLRV